MSNITSQLIVRLIDGVSGPARQAAGSLRGIGTAARQINGGGLASASARLTGAIDRNNAAIADLQGRLGSAAAAGYGLARALVGIVRPAVELESKVADLEKVAGMGAGLPSFVRQLRALSPVLAKSSAELLDMATAGSAAGVSNEELLGYTELTAKAALAWGMNAAQAGENLAKIKTQLGLTTAELRLYVDGINVLEDSTAASAGDMTDFARRVAAMGEFYGFSREQTLALGASMVATGAQADVAATSFRAIGRALTRGASATKAQRAAYKALGLDAANVSKAMQSDAIGATVDVIERINRLPQDRQASVLSDLFGDEARAIAPLLTQTDMLRKNLAAVADETKVAGSVQREFEVRSRTTENALARLRNRVDEVATEMGNALLPALRDAAEAVGPLLDRMRDFAAAHPKLVAGAVAIASGLVALNVAAIGTAIAGRFALGGLLLLARGVLAPIRALAGAAAAARNAVALQRALGAMSGLRLGGWGTIATVLRGVAMAIPLVGAALTGPVVAGLAVFAAAGVLIYKYWDRIASFVSGFASALADELAPAFETIRPLMQPVLDLFSSIGRVLGGVVGSVGDLLASLFSREILTDDQKAGWRDAGASVARGMVESVKSVIGELVAWFGGLPGRILSAIGNINVGSLITWPSLPSWMGGGSGAPAAPEPGAGGIGARAIGGRVSRGSAYVVGERRPEVFTPSSDGYVHSRVPSATAGASVTISQTFHVSGAQDPAALVQQVKRALQTDVRDGLRAVMGDVGMTVA